ncbi:MAG: CDP-diacylglycerol--serine O-phosphatidyltransferase [Bacteroidales bacterium]|nr:CDP-diacylglycerol--serine O-phosphatidyltransferase [Lentimicrobiaceae bacterium]MDD5693700.1 CDP-diacylglycerol--serine O-phosphatidyltransferase [Bacteroidales bacterium]
MKKNLPNLITLLNLVSGTLAIVFILRDQLVMGSLCITIALVLDFLDGFLARLLHAYSALGEQLDSLADLVSFGVAPGYIIWSLMNASGDPGGGLWSDLSPYIALLIPVFSALRLARFTIDDSQKYIFRGLPTPASAIFIGALPVILESHHTPSLVQNFIADPLVLTVITILISFLMVAPVNMLSLKFTDFSWKLNWLRYLILIISVPLILLLKAGALPVMIILYVLLSIFFVPQRWWKNKVG